MVILVMGASHTGKTALSQRLMEKYKIPYLSIDHLKMGLIRSQQTNLTVEDDCELTAYLWPIVREMIKTVIENQQHLIVEGIYIPFDYQQDFCDEYLKEIQAVCLIMSTNYIQDHFQDIVTHANMIENRINDELDQEDIIKENELYLQQCTLHHISMIDIEKEYDVDKVFEMVGGKCE